MSLAGVRTKHLVAHFIDVSQVLTLLLARLLTYCRTKISSLFLSLYQLHPYNSFSCFSLISFVREISPGLCLAVSYMKYPKLNKTLNPKTVRLSRLVMKFVDAYLLV